MRVGRDHVASTVNTLALAYAGSALPLLLLFTQSRQSLGTVANGETIATVILGALVGSIGLVASVPVTTWLAARVVTAGDRRGPGSRRPTRRAPARRERTAEDEFWETRGRRKAHDGPVDLD
jgi:hypothetical protein